MSKSTAMEEKGQTMSMICEAATPKILDLDEQLFLRGNILRRHLSTIKNIATLMLCVTFCATPGFVILAQRLGTQCSPRSVSEEMKPQVNVSACVFTKHYHLQDNIYATVCNLDGYVFLDVRQFVNGTATVIGVDLSLTQWLTLKQLTPNIDSFLAKAQTYGVN